MAERRAANKYYPPDWDPSKGSINRFNNSHPLRARARKIDQGILTIRFEMPFNIWCSKCDNHIGMGVRFNAEKSKVGNYYSSPIYKFRMKCHLCENYFEIHSDPSKFDYTVISGARRQMILPEDTEAIDDLKSDGDAAKNNITSAIFNLEKSVEDKLQNDAQLPSLQDIKQWRSRWQDSFTANQTIRSQYRERRKKIIRAKETNRRLLAKTSLKIPLLEADPADKSKAKELAQHAYLDQLKRQEESKKHLLLKPTLNPPAISSIYTLKVSKVAIRERSRNMKLDKDHEDCVKKESNSMNSFIKRK